MQKVIGLALILLSPVSQASVDPAIVAKIKGMTRTVVAQERKAFKNSKDAFLMEVAGQRFDNMLLRLGNMQASLAYFSRMKRKLTIDVMDRLTPEVARACCPLNPGALQGQRWYFKGKGNKMKGKGLSGLRDKEKKDKEKKGKGRKRGRGKRGRADGPSETE